MKINKENGIFNLPDADHVDGISLHKGANWQLSTITLQYRNASAGLCQVSMTVPNALYLLSLLEALSADHNYEQHRHPSKA